MCTLNYTKLKILFQCEENTVLPEYLGSTLRGAMGNELKRVCCLKDLSYDCMECEYKHKCHYTYFFLNIHCNNTNTQIKHNTNPNPFVIEPPLNRKRSYREGDLLEFDLLLVGENTQYLPYFVVAAENMAKKGLGVKRSSFILKGIYNSNTNKPIYVDGKLESNNIKINTWTFAELRKDFQELKIKLVTPFRCINNGKIVSNMDFKLFMRNVFRRLSVLSSFYCGDTWNIDYSTYLRSAEKIKIQNISLEWKDWERYSSRQKSKIKMGGMMGQISFKGHLSDFLPFIDIASILHIGKGCTMGLGKFEWEAV